VEAGSFVKTLSLKVEFFWLCEDCAPKMTVVFVVGKGVTVKPLLPVFKKAS